VKRLFLIVMLTAFALPAMAAAPMVQVLREELRIQEDILDADVEELGSRQDQIDAAWNRVERLAADLIRAQQEGEDSASLRLRDEDLRTAEAELLMHVLEAQRQRRTVIATKSMIERKYAELRRLTGGQGVEPDPLSGRWRIVLEPGALNGIMTLELNGTLVSGTYRLDGGWGGSLRGTLVADKVRLERIDSQIGFASILYGKLEARRRPPRLAGTWEATQLASGLPSAGSWLAERIEVEETQ